MGGQGLKQYNNDIASKGNEEVGFRSHTFCIAKLNQEEIQMILPLTKEYNFTGGMRFAYAALHSQRIITQDLKHARREEKYFGPE